MSARQAVQQLEEQLNLSVIGQPTLVNRLLIALLVDGHLLVEGAPGLAKTRAIKALANHIEADFQRIQFTPDLLPADLTGTEIYRPADGSFVFQKGPLFNNLVLADEVNRAPAKVQSALLEAMAEQQISVGHQTYKLPSPFMVLATQNPIEQEGTYSLPEAQLDRFLMQVLISYPNVEDEVKILRLVRDEAISSSGSNEKATSADAVENPSANVEHQNKLDIFSLDNLLSARQEVLQVYMANDIEDYIVRLVAATREPAMIDENLSRYIQYGASPRGTLSLDACSRAHAWLSGRDYVSPGDVQAVFDDVMRHRVLLSFEAEAEGVDSGHVLHQILTHIAVP